MQADGSMREVSRETFERICAEDAARGFDPDAWEDQAAPAAARDAGRMAGLPPEYGLPPQPPPPSPTLRDPDAEPLPVAVLRRQTYARIEAAVAAGRMHEARGWTRLLINLGGVSTPPAPRGPDAPPSRDDADERALIRCIQQVAEAGRAVAEAQAEARRAGADI